MTFYHFVMKILRRFHLKYALGTSNYLLLGRGEWWVLLGRWLSYSFYRFYSTSPVNHVKIGSYVSCAFIEIWSTWEVWLRLDQLLRIFRALQTSRVFHISMNARSRMNQLLSLKHAIHFNWFCKEHWSLSIKRCLHRSQKFLSGSFNTSTLYSTHVIT